MLWNVLKIVGTAIAAAGLSYLVCKIIIDAGFLKKRIKEECPDSFKILIKEKKKNAVKVGIFDVDERGLGDMTVKSEKGVSDSIYEGQVIYC